MNSNRKIRVLFVCMGNICRSPTAEAVFARLLGEKGLAGQFEIDSAGTHAYHVGHPPDERSAETAQQRGLDMRGQRARQVSVEDLEYFDHILAMDRGNLAELNTLQAHHGGRARLGLLLECAADAEVSEVPDPYFGGARGFDRVFDLIEAGCSGLLQTLRPQIPI